MNFITSVVILIFMIFLLLITNKLPFTGITIKFFESARNFEFKLAALQQMLVVIFGIIFFTSYGYLTIILINISTGLLREIIKRLDLLESNSRINKTDEIMKCIKIHKMIQKLVIGIEDLFGFNFFVKAIINTLYLTFSIFIMTESDEPTVQFIAFYFFVPVELEIFFPCYFGQNLKNASKIFIKIFKFHSERCELNEFERQKVENFKKANEHSLQISYFNLYDLNMTTFFVGMFIIICAYFVMIMSK